MRAQMATHPLANILRKIEEHENGPRIISRRARRSRRHDGAEEDAHRHRHRDDGNDAEIAAARGTEDEVEAEKTEWSERGGESNHSDHDHDADTGEQDEEDEECSICLGPIKEPEALPCGHRYCAGCVAALRERQHGDAARLHVRREEDSMHAYFIRSFRS